MSLEKGLKFMGNLGSVVELESEATPEHPAHLFSHPIISLTEKLIKGLDPRIDSYALTEPEEERKRALMSQMDIQNLMIMGRGGVSPFRPDPRIILPYRGHSDGMDLSVGIVPDTYLTWKNDGERLYAVFAAAVEGRTRVTSSTRAATEVQSNSAATYFENGVITWLSIFRTGNHNQPYAVVMQYFVPPEMDVKMIKPPYERLNEHLAHPTELPHLTPLIDSAIQKVNSQGMGYLSVQMRNDLNRNSKMAMLFADAHRRLYST